MTKKQPEAKTYGEIAFAKEQLSIDDYRQALKELWLPVAVHEVLLKDKDEEFQASGNTLETVKEFFNEQIKVRDEETQKLEADKTLLRKGLTENEWFSKLLGKVWKEEDLGEPSEDEKKWLAKGSVKDLLKTYLKLKEENQKLKEALKKEFEAGCKTQGELEQAKRTINEWREEHNKVYREKRTLEGQIEEYRKWLVQFYPKRDEKELWKKWQEVFGKSEAEKL